MNQPDRIQVNGREDIFLVRNFLTPEECLGFINLSEHSGYEAAKVATALGQVVARDVRNNDRLIWDDVALAARWWEKAKAFFPREFGRWQAIGLNERFRFYRYGPGQKFAQHRDGSFERSPDELSWMTFMVYLNDDFEGGSTRFDLAGEAEPVEIVPERGTALAFMHDRLHEGAAVRAGIRYVLRTDVMYRKH